MPNQYPSQRDRAAIHISRKHRGLLTQYSKRVGIPAKHILEALIEAVVSGEVEVEVKATTKKD